MNEVISKFAISYSKDFILIGKLWMLVEIWSGKFKLLNHFSHYLRINASTKRINPFQLSIFIQHHPQFIHMCNQVVQPLYISLTVSRIPMVSHKCSYQTINGFRSESDSRANKPTNRQAKSKRRDNFYWQCCQKSFFR